MDVLPCALVIYLEFLTEKFSGEEEKAGTMLKKEKIMEI